MPITERDKEMINDYDKAVDSDNPYAIGDVRKQIGLRAAEIGMNPERLKEYIDKNEIGTKFPMENERSAGHTRKEQEPSLFRNIESKLEEENAESSRSEGEYKEIITQISRQIDNTPEGPLKEVLKRNLETLRRDYRQHQNN